MNVIDISLLVMLGGFVLAGFWFGVIQMVGAIVGVVLGAAVAGRFYEPAANILVGATGGNANLAKIIAFIVLFLLVTKLVAVAFWVIEKIFKIVAIIPFLKTFNRLLGALLGLVEGTLVLGLGVYFVARFPATAAFEMLLRESQVARAFHPVGAILAPLLPAALRAVRSVLG